MMGKKLKVVWICWVSNAKIRQRLDLSVPKGVRLIRRLFGKNELPATTDLAQWNTNAINVVKTIKDVEWHIIFLHSHMRHSLQFFVDSDVNYYAIKDESSYLWCHLIRKMWRGNYPYLYNRRRIKKIVSEIKPDIIHLIGAENPQYSLSLLDVPTFIPTIVQLQTLLSDPVVIQTYELQPFVGDKSPRIKFSKNKNMQAQYDCEHKVILRADYIGTQIEKFKKIIKNSLKPDAKFVNTSLAVGETFAPKNVKKVYDFVYFASNISKAVDLAIEAFALARAKVTSLTLNIIGGSDENFISIIKKRVEELELTDVITYEGRLKTHEDVLNQIDKSRFALLPLRIDFVSSTIREAISMGLPVITTITDGTILLNSQRESVLLSPIGDSQAMADNMVRLYCDQELADELRQNARITAEESYGTESVIKEWVDVYRRLKENTWG